MVQRAMALFLMHATQNERVCSHAGDGGAFTKLLESDGAAFFHNIQYIQANLLIRPSLHLK
jgi:hypothetical protein